MKRIYDKTTRELMKDFAKTLQPDQKISRKQIFDWFEKKYSKIKRATIGCHIIRLTINAPSRIHYNAATDGSDDIFIQLPDGQLRLYDKSKDQNPIYPESILDNEGKESEIEESYDDVDRKEFAYEADLKNFLAKNLNFIEKGLTLYNDDGITGIEFDAGGRKIDILAVDKDENYVVIELKVSRGYDRVIGQLLRYTAWIKAKLAEENQTVRGIIIARNITDDLKLACTQIANVTLYEYTLSVQLSKI